MRTAFWIAAAALGLAPPAGAQVTMDALWPNADGLGWTFEQHYESYGPNPEVVDNQFRMFFDGVVVAPNGIEAQYLRHQLLGGPAARDAGRPAGPFFRQLWLARPDLRERIRRTLDAECPQYAPPGSYAVMLSGEFAYRKTAGEIAAWRCNAADTRSWLWLVSDLTLGTTFTLQLLPDLANDVFLHGRIAAIETATVPAGTFNGCVRVEYTVDYGLGECTDPNGAPLGTYRSETRGWIRYAPGVGPVETRETWIPYAEATGSCAPPGSVGQPHSLATLELASATVAARPLTWGRLKRIYR